VGRGKKRIENTKKEGRTSLRRKRFGGKGVQKDGETKATGEGLMTIIRDIKGRRSGLVTNAKAIEGRR